MRDALEDVLEKRSRGEVAERCGVKGPAVSQWKRKNSPTESHARAIFEMAGHHPDAWRDDAVSLAETDMRRLSKRLVLAPEVLQKISVGEMGQDMDGLNEEVRRAVLAAVHLTGFPLEHVIKTAKSVMVKHPNAAMSASMWFEAIRDDLRGRPPSGTIPAVRPFETKKKRKA